jgi:hypothetical protein
MDFPRRVDELEQRVAATKAAVQAAATESREQIPPCQPLVRRLPCWNW